MLLAIAPLARSMSQCPTISEGVYPPVENREDKPLSKASHGDCFRFLGVTVDSTESEFLQGKDPKESNLEEVRPCLRRSGYAQAGQSFFERFTLPVYLEIYSTLGFIVGRLSMIKVTL